VSESAYGMHARRALSGLPTLALKLSPFTLLGLPLLYAAAYFLPLISTMGAYFLPSKQLFAWIVAPTLQCVAAGALFMYVVAMIARNWLGPRIIVVGVVFATSLMTLIALKDVLAAAGYEWEDLIPHSSSPLAEARIFKLAGWAVVIALIWNKRAALPQIVRLLSSLGLAFGVLAAIRIVTLGHELPTSNQPAAATLAMLPLGARNSGPDASGNPLTANLKSRRVVWVLFDETDFDRVYGADSAGRPSLPNFQQLAGVSVFADAANSPASATLYSVPALLTGSPISGAGIRIDRFASLWLERRDGSSLPFEEATTIFGALGATGRTASVLGFFHPYCKIFTVQRCDSFRAPLSAIGSLRAALVTNLPTSIAAGLGQTDSWPALTRDSLSLLPAYLKRDDSLTFIHLNTPHLPATYADQIMGLPTSSNPLTEYSRNLMLADRILGEIVQTLRAQSSRHDLLLVVSTDHWLRNRWYRANEPEVSRPVPLMMWKVGDANGIALSQPLSSVHTAAMILDYLNGQIDSQADIARWWAGQPVYPSFIAPNT
jgi:hypothetical protein